DARSEVEQKIDDALRGKIEEFLELSNYDWELANPSGRASDHITDLMTFMQTTFLSFTNLPPVLARHVCMQACKHLASRLMAMLLDPDLKAISMGALEQFNLDVIQCELFTSQCPVPGFENGTLTMTFADLRQLLDLLMSFDWTSYLADFGQERNKYVRVKPTTAIAVLEKIMELDRRKNSFFGKDKNKDRKKLLDTVLKQLRSLAHA
uniref:Exocyst complex component 6 n=1 Tax=Plectus sambesii TaxID=2011161 RepID=A0A914XT61_9BILA